MPPGDAMNEAVAKIARGDRRAFAVLFEYFGPRIVTYLTRSGMPTACAEDLAQEALVLVWRKAGSFNSTRGSVSTWIFTIARNLRTDHYRRDGQEHLAVDTDVSELADPAPPPDERLTALERDGHVRAALGRLSSEQLRLLQLSFFAGKSHAYIARSLSLPLGTVKSNIRRTLSVLRHFLDTPES